MIRYMFCRFSTNLFETMRPNRHRSYRRFANDGEALPRQMIKELSNCWNLGDGALHNPARVRKGNWETSEKGQAITFFDTGSTLPRL